MHCIYCLSPPLEHKPHGDRAVIYLIYCSVSASYEFLTYHCGSPFTKGLICGLLCRALPEGSSRIQKGGWAGELKEVRGSLEGRTGFPRPLEVIKADKSKDLYT